MAEKKPINKEIIYRANSIISIETLPDYPQPVVVKKPAKKHSSPQYVRSLEKEYEMTRALDEVKGVRKALEQKSVDNQPVLILENIDGEILRDYNTRKRLSLRSKLKIAIDLARILSEIHKKNIIHLDINSSNILIGSKKRTVHFIDLGSAHQIDRSGLQKIGPDQLLGNLPYISPEQTGRINRSVDERSDLYSLGVVLYELMTGQLPFDSKDPLELVHQHIARLPVSPSTVSEKIPQVLSAIILKLLSKNAEDRYHSAAGLQSDLEKCLQLLTPKNTIEEFSLGEADFPNRLKFPQNLYGRDRELKELEIAFESVCRDTSAIVFVGGNSGIGKTALVQEIQRPVSEKNGYFIQGKFDQLATIPYSGIAQALTRLVSRILTQTENQLTALRSKILEAVGPNGRVLMDVVPSLELVIGPQQAVPDLSGQEAQNRFNYIFQRFFAAIARSEHPICFFLDDLQWIDLGSLSLLKNLFSGPDLAHLLVVGAYRDNEVDEDHPLMTLLADLEKAGANLKRMTLPKLAEADVNALISDTLWRDPGEIGELSRLIHAQTNGNPFFTRQVLRSLEDQGLLALDTTTGHWRWDMDALRDLDVTASVVELLVGKLKELPADTQETLKVAACIGSQFDIAILTVVTAGDDEAILDHVREAITAGLIWERDDRGFFVHDRVQEAAYTLVPIEERDRLHLTIGRLLLQRHRVSDHEQNLFRIVDQLNHGLHLVEDEQERMQIARLNLQAARAAGRNAAFKAGLTHARAGLELLGEDAWERHYRLTLELHEQAALMAHSAGDIPGMEQHSEQVLQHGRDPLDLAKVQGMRLIFLSASNRLKDALDLGLETLRSLGQEFPADPDWELAAAKVAELHNRIERENPDFLSMPPLHDQDPQLAAISEIFIGIAGAAYITSPALCVLIFVRCLELCVTRRLLPACSPWLIVGQGIHLSALLGKVEAAHEYGEKSVRLAERESFRTFMPSALYHQGRYVHFWRYPLRETLDLFTRGIEISHDYGDNQFIAYLTAVWSRHAFWASIALDRMVEQATQLRDFLDVFHYDVQRRWLNIFVTAAQALRGGSFARGASWRGTPFDDERDLPDMEQSGDRQGLLFAYCAKAWVATLFGDHSSVEKCIDLAQYNLKTGAGLLENASIPFVYGLRYARELRENPDRPESEQALQEQLGLLERFAGLAPMNFAHKLSLVQAEVHRARGEILPAMQAYEKAAQGALENDYLNEAGFAYALAAEFHRDIGLQQAALHNVEKAALAWRSWGADALVESLSHRFADLLETSGISGQISTDEAKVQTTITRPITSIQMDLDSILDASKTLSSETDLDQLKAKMMKLLMTESGATKTLLMLKQEDNWFVQARSDEETGRDDTNIKEPYNPAEPEDAPILSSVFNYCLRTKEVVVVGDVRHDSRFTEDRIVLAGEIRSMACIPVFSKGEVKAMIYLENRQVEDVFNPERIDILKHLSSQFGISIENALLYDSLAQKIQELQESDERYELTIAGSTAGLWDWDITSNKVYYSDRFKELLGYEPEEFGDTPEVFFDRLHPDDLENIRMAIDNHLKDQIPYKVEYRLQTKSGEYRWFNARGQALWDKKGIATRMSGSIVDISERKQIEEGLHKSKEFNQAVLMSLPSHIAVLDREGTILTVNDAWIKFARRNDAKYPDAVGPGVNYLKICQEASINGDETITTVLDGIRSVMDGSLKFFETEYPCHSPTENLWFLMTVIPFKGLKGGTIVAHTNITARMQAEKELLESEVRFRSVVENANETIVVAQDKTVKYSNPQVYKLTAYTPEELRSWDFLEFIHPEDHENVSREYQSRLSGERAASEYSVRIITKDGQEKYILISSALIDWDGRPATLAMLTDITALKKAESDLIISEQRYELAAAGSDAGIWDYNISTGEIYISDRFKELLGYGPEELEFRSAEEAWSNLHPDFSEKVPRAMQDHLEKKVPFYSIDYLARMKSGEYRWFQARGMAKWDENGQATRIAGSFIDIHEQKIAEEKIKRSERHFRSLMESSPLSIAIFTPDGNISQVNDAFKKLWGLSEQEASEVIANYNFISDKQLENLGFRPLVERAFKGESVILPPLTYNANTTTDDIGLENIEARSRMIQVHIHSIKDAKGEIEFVVGINMDLTKLKQAEQETQEQKEILARVGRTSRMGQLTGSIAHELSQPLTGILSNAQAAELMLNNERWESAEMKDIMGDIIADVKRCGDVIRNLRDLYREQRGIFVPVDINKVVDETMQLLHSEFIFQQVNLVNECAPNLPKINGNAIQLQQVLVNLIMNGIQAMSDVERNNRQLHVATAQDKKSINLWVEDRGPGIPADKIDHIFEPLATWKPGGTGMGLAISNSILEAHEGKMWAENKPEGGARVGFALPVLKEGQK